MAALYDKLQLRGVGSLTDEELLSLILDDGSDEALVRAQELLQQCGGSLTGMGRADLARLRMTAGIGLKRAARLTVAAELGRRMMALEAASEVAAIASTEDVVRIFRPQMLDLAHEECWALYLTSSNRIIERARVSQGGVQGTVVDHRLVVKRALELLATQLILVHNHPSGTAEPSEEDKRLTQRIADAAALFDIRLLDHLILTRNDFYTFRGHNLL